MSCLAPARSPLSQRMWAARTNDSKPGEDQLKRGRGMEPSKMMPGDPNRRRMRFMK